MFTVMFAVSRSIGWIVHWIEMMTEENIKISNKIFLNNLKAGQDKYMLVMMRGNMLILRIEVKI